MCLNPIKIRNNYKNKPHYASEKGNITLIPSHLVSQADYFYVGCGTCAECRQTYYNSILQRAIVESFTSYIFFVTLTYDNNHLPCISINDEKFYFADYDQLQSSIKRFRDSGVLGREFRYLSVNEYGDNSNRPHFHLLFFVAKHKGDNEQTPEYLRKIIFDNLKIFWSVNKGTRKNPIYEPLFTYYWKYNAAKKRIETNFFVKYVEPEEFYSITDEKCQEDNNYIKTIKYLIGYLNKPSRYEQKLECIINSYKEDTYKFNYYKRLLKSQIRYSKGFGCGFDVKGNKYYMEKISVRASANVLYYTEFTDNLPDTYEEFCDTYEDINEDLIQFRNSDIYRKHNNWRKCLNSMSSNEYMLHCINLKYFKKEFNSIYRNFADNVKPTVSYQFGYTHKEYLYDMQKVRTTNSEDSLVYRFLRQGVEEGLRAGAPYLAFRLIGQNSKFQALCSYYKERVCTIEDYIKLFKRLGVNNYEEYIAQFEQQKSLRRTNISSGNVLKYYKFDTIPTADVKVTISSKDLYNKL